MPDGRTHCALIGGKPVKFKKIMFSLYQSFTDSGARGINSLAWASEESTMFIFSASKKIQIILILIGYF